LCEAIDFRAGPPAPENDAARGSGAVYIRSCRDATKYPLGEAMSREIACRSAIVFDCFIAPDPGKA